MSLGGLVFIAFIVGGLIVGVYALIAGGISFLNRPHVSYSTMRAWAVVMAVWALGWCAGFFGHDPAGNVIGISLVIAFVVLVLAGMVIVARMSFGWWAPLLAGMILAGTYIAGAVGDYAAHAWGWHGESLDRYGGEMGPTVGIAIAVFVSPAFFLAGLIVGLIARAVVWRRPAPTP